MRLCIALVVGLQACELADRAAPDFSRDSPVRKTAEQEVYNAAYAAIVTSRRPSVVFVIPNKTLWFGDSTRPALSQPAWRDFIRRSHESGVVPPLDIDLLYHHRISGLELRGDVTDTAVIAFSGVGFSPAGDEAVLLMEYRCGTRCGMAAFGWFRRRGDGWVLSKADTSSRR